MFRRGSPEIVPKWRIGVEEVKTFAEVKLKMKPGGGNVTRWWWRVLVTGTTTTRRITTTMSVSEEEWNRGGSSDNDATGKGQDAVGEGSEVEGTEDSDVSLIEYMSRSQQDPKRGGGAV